MPVSSCTFLSKKINHIKEHKMTTCGSWRYIRALWSEIISLCKKLNIIYNIIAGNPEPQANSPILLNQLFLVN